MAGHAAALMHEPQQRDQADRLMAQVLKVTADTCAATIKMREERQSG